MQAEHSLVLRPNPFCQSPGVIAVHGGQTLLGMLQEAAQSTDIVDTLRVEIGGHEVPRAFWAKVKPKAGVPIHATVMPKGGSGGKILRTVLLVALTVFTAGVASGAYLAGVSVAGLSGAALGAAIGLVGTMAINALIPPPVPKLGDLGGGEAPGRWMALTGTSNRLTQYGAIPLVLGKHKLFPPHAAMPYTETLGDTVYQRLMFDLGHGDLEVTDIKIGDTPIESFEGVQYEITKTPTLYTSDVNEVAVSAALNVADEVVSVERTTDAGIDEISLDIVFPAGLFGYDDKGKLIIARANITVEYREHGTSTWTVVPINSTTRVEGLYPQFPTQVFASQAVTGNKKPFAVAVAWKVTNDPAKSYDVKVTRGVTDWGTASSTNRIGDAAWTVLRSITRTNPSTTGTNKLCMRIKSSEQLNGTLDSLNCVVAQKIPVYDADTETWSANTANFNFAWVYHWLLKGAGGAFVTSLADSRIDLDSLVPFAQFCEDNGFLVGGVLESQQPMGEFLKEFLACALATPTMRDGRYGVLFDAGDTTPSMVFSQLDSRPLPASRPFLRLPHALRVEFRNPDADWEIDSIIVLDDGYSLNGVDARGNASSDPEPTEFETLTLRYTCDAFSAWRIARCHMAQGKYRLANYPFETDVANLSVTRGDCVHVTSDVHEWGAGAGWIVSIDGTTVVLDQRIETDPAKSYSMRLRASDGSSEVIAVTPHSPETETFYLASAPTKAAVGDAAIVGETGSETAILYVTGIQPGAELSARLNAVMYDARVAPFWANPPETIASAITGATYRAGPEPPAIDVVTDIDNEGPDDAGIHEPEVHVRIREPGGFVHVYDREAA